MCSDAPITKISPWALREILGSEDVVILDVRDIDFYTGYIPGSQRAPWPDFDITIHKIYEQYGRRDVLIVFLCYLSETRATSCARQFRRYLDEECKAYNCRLSVLEGGFQKWEQVFHSHADRDRYLSWKYEFGQSYTEGAAGEGSSRPTAQTEGALPSFQPVPQQRSRRAASTTRASELAKLEHLELNSEELATAEEWRLHLKVGDMVEIRRRMSWEWCSAVVVRTHRDTVSVRYIQDKKCFGKVVSRSSQDIRRKATRDSDACIHRSKALTPTGGFARALQEGGNLSGGTPTIYVEDLAKLLGSDMVQVIDVRGLDYLNGHIPGARHIPRAFFEDKLPALANEFAKSGKTLVFHCGESFYRGPQCAQRFLDFMNENYTSNDCKALVLKGGFERWANYARGAAKAETLNLVEKSTWVPDELLAS